MWNLYLPFTDKRYFYRVHTSYTQFFSHEQRGGVTARSSNRAAGSAGCGLCVGSVASTPWLCQLPSIDEQQRRGHQRRRCRVRERRRVRARDRKSDVHHQTFEEGRRDHAGGRSAELALTEVRAASQRPHVSGFRTRTAARPFQLSRVIPSVSPIYCTHAGGAKLVGAAP